MKIRKIPSILLLTLTMGISTSLFAGKIGVAIEGDSSIHSAVSEALKADGHSVVDVSSSTQGVKLDSVAAASIGKSTGVEIIVSGKKLGGMVILKVLSTKNDTVAGGTASDPGGAVDQVKKILSANRSKMAR
jgi:hypothetical protein